MIFLKLHNRASGKEVLVNFDMVEQVCVNEYLEVELHFSGDNWLRVTESMEDIESALKKVVEARA